MVIGENICVACYLVHLLSCEEQKQHEDRQRQKPLGEFVIGLQRAELHGCELEHLQCWKSVDGKTRRAIEMQWRVQEWQA